MKQINWNLYKDIFPNRYIKEGYFDNVIDFIIKSNNSISTILDIGGGNGTNVLKKIDRLKIVDLLDPYVKKQEWMGKNINWDHKVNRKYDLAIARGSINYLTKKQIKSIPNLANKFLANSFANSPSTTLSSRRYETIHLQRGVEFFIYRPESRTVEHMLSPDRDEMIKHSFFYYSIKDYSEMLNGVKIIYYNQNSILLYWENTNV